MKKAGISVKEKQTAQLGNVRESYTHQNTQIHDSKKKILFIPMKVQLITISSAVPYILKKKTVQAVSSTQEKVSRKRKREGKRGRESVKEKEKEKEREEERVRKIRRKRKKRMKKRRK